MSYAGIAPSVNNFDAVAPTTTKGDTIICTGSTNVRLPVGADGRIVIADSAQTNGAAYFQTGIGIPGYVSGRYYGPWMTAVTATLSLSANTAYYVPVYVCAKNTFTGISAWPTVAVAISAHFGVYATSAGKPGALVAGSDVTVALLVAASQNDAVFSSAITLSPGWYWLCVLVNGTCTFTDVPASCHNNVILGAGTLATSATSMGQKVSASQTYGALPDPAATATFTDNAGMPYLALKAQ